MVDVSYRQEWFTGQNMVHPLAHPETAKVLIARQSGGDAATVLRRITDWIAELQAIPGLALADRFAVLDLLDQQAKNHQLSLVPEFLETARLRKLSEGELWTTSFAFWKAITDAYLHCLDSYQAATPTEVREFDPQLPILVNRILRSLTLQFKWTSLRHDHVDAKLWSELGRTYLFAESRGFAATRIPVYPSRHGHSSAQEELLKVLMFAVSGPDALTPLHQHIAERIVAHFGDQFEITTEAGTAASFTFDLATGLPPSRGPDGKRANLLVRHFGPGRAIEGLEELKAHVERTGDLPLYINAGAALQRPMIESVLRHLSVSWANQITPRRAERRAATLEFHVLPGVIDNARWLEHLLDAGSLDAAPDHATSWQISDTSEHGCGAIAQPGDNDWAAIGTLVGMRNDNDWSYRMGIVRRMRRDPYDQDRMGVEIIGDTAVPVQLFSALATQIEGRDVQGERALLVSKNKDAQGLIELLTRPSSVSTAPRLQMRFHGRVYRIEEVGVLEEQRDYRWVKYRLLQAPGNH